MKPLLRKLAAVGMLSMIIEQLFGHDHPPHVHIDESIEVPWTPAPVAMTPPPVRRPQTGWMNNSMFESAASVIRQYEQRRRQVHAAMNNVIIAPLMPPV
jgi:hypothetical protein